MTVSIMLVNHHHLMRAAPHATNALFWWNSALLFWMSLIPLTTSVLGDSPTVPLSVAFYGAVLACTAFSFTLLHRTAACLANRNGKLGDIHRKIVVKDSYFTALYCASGPLAYVSVYAALAIFFLIPCAYFFPEFIPRLRFK